jgi:multiple sugar transport system substrate-binding protein
LVHAFNPSAKNMGNVLENFNTVINLLGLIKYSRSLKGEKEMQTRKKFLKLLVPFIIASMMLIMMAGCGSTGEPSEQGSEPDSKTITEAPASTGEDSGNDSKLQEGITLRMWTFLDPTKTSGREVALKQIIDNFEKEYNIKVVVEPQVWDVMTAKFFAAHQAGNAPDIQWVNVDDMGTAVKMNALEPLENLFVKDWTEEQLADIYDSFWEFGSVDGKHYQIGFSRNYIGIIYREDLLKEAGFSVPFKNWDEFREAAKKLSVEKDPITGTKRYGFGAAFSTEKSDPLIITNMLLAENGSLFSADGKAAWANDIGIKGVNMLKDMVKVDKSMPEDLLTQTVEDLYKDFSSGKYAMINGASVRIEKMQSECVFDPSTIRLMPFPSFTEGKPSPTVITGWAVGVWSGGKYKQEAGKFLEYMASPESDKLWVELGGQVPMNKSTVDLLGDFLKDPSKRYLTDTADAFAKAGWAQPTEFTITGWRADFCQVMQDVITKNADPLKTLQNAEKEFNERNGR